MASIQTTSAVVPTAATIVPVSIKLDRTNYVLWLAQFVPFLKSKNLMGFVDGTNSCPPKYKEKEDGTVETTVNPLFIVWDQQDQTILSWLNGSMTPSVLSTVARFTTSRDVWKSLERRYASQSKTRILQLMSELHNTKRGDLSISDYVDKINSIADNLALAGNAIDDDTLVTIIMRNVGPTYEVTVSSAQARDTPISYDDLVALLLAVETRMKEQNLPHVDTNATALYAPRMHNPSRGRGFSNNRGKGKGRGSGRFSNSRGSTDSPASSYSSTRISC